MDTADSRCPRPPHCPPAFHKKDDDCCLKCKKIDFFGAQLGHKFQFAPETGSLTPEPQWAFDPDNANWYLFVFGECNILKTIWCWDPLNGWRPLLLESNTSLCLYATALANPEGQVLLGEPHGTIWTHPGANFIFDQEMIPLICPRGDLLLETKRSIILEFVVECCKGLWKEHCRIDKCKIIDHDSDTFVSVCRDNFVDIQAQNGLVARFDPRDAAGTVPVSGAGSRLMYHTFKAALRSGTVDGDQWDDVNIGQNTVAFGANNTARGANSSVTAGNSNTISDDSTNSSIQGGVGNSVNAANRSAIAAGSSLTLDQDNTLMTQRWRQTGGSQVAIIGVSTDTTLDLDNEYVTVDTTTADVTLTLPVSAVGPPVSPVMGQRYHIKHLSGANTLTIDGNGNNVDPGHSIALPSIVVPVSEIATLVWNGSIWVRFDCCNTGTPA